MFSDFVHARAVRRSPTSVGWTGGVRRAQCPSVRLIMASECFANLSAAAAAAVLFLLAWSKGRREPAGRSCVNMQTMQPYRRSGELLKAPFCGEIVSRWSLGRTPGPKPTREAGLKAGPGVCSRFMSFKQGVSVVPGDS